MNNPQPLLSICIPTFNRASYLKEALDSMVMDPAFGEKMEIIISDNASSDETQTIGEEYAAKYPNIHYFRNEENVKDANFELSLRRGNGRYRKLSNDTIRYTPGTLSQMIDTIGKSDFKTPLFFYPNINRHYYNSHTTVTSADEVVDCITYYIGWIGAFGLWAQDLDCLQVDRKYLEMMFVQVAWFFKLQSKHKKINLYFGDFYYLHQPVKKGSYPLFKVHLTNLSHIMRDHNIKGLTYERFKFRLLVQYMSHFIYSFKYLDRPTGFDLSGMWSTLLKEYGFRPYLYPLMFYLKSKSIMRRMIYKYKKRSNHHEV